MKQKAKCKQNIHIIQQVTIQKPYQVSQYTPNDAPLVIINKILETYIKRSFCPSTDIHNNV